MEKQQFEIGDIVTVIKADNNVQKTYIGKVFVIEKFSQDCAHGTLIETNQKVALYLYKLELNEICMSPLWKALK